MAIFNHKRNLMNVSPAVNTAQVGTVWALLEGRSGGGAQNFKVWFDLTQAGGATSPTTKAKLQTSHDGTKWADVVESTQLAADGSLSEWKAANDLGPYVRVVTVLGGGTLPNHTAAVILLSDEEFNVKQPS